VLYSLQDIKRYHESKGKKKLILDTNLLLVVLIFSAFGEAYLKECKLTHQYSMNDIMLLKEVFQYFDKRIIIASHTVAEISNLGRKVPDNKLHQLFASFVKELRTFEERHSPLVCLLDIEVKILSRFGFPDMSITEVAKGIEDSVIFTDDFPLFIYVQSLKIPSINFTNVRSFS